RYPETLDELVPVYLAKPPIDPWSGQQLIHYTLRPGGRPALWSIGENQEDDHGYTMGDYGDSDDITWQYELSPDDPNHPDRNSRAVLSAPVIESLNQDIRRHDKGREVRTR
ncbi:MAG: hypothetical protein O3C21_08905, partial [Verrucomicrobia bacterium]|nr:hypothetical protein [Verrucomicrobiota bacterium]